MLIDFGCVHYVSGGKIILQKYSMWDENDTPVGVRGPWF